MGSRDQVRPQKTAEFIHGILEANRNNYTDNVVVELSRDGIEAHEHRAMNEASRFRLSFCWNQAGSWPSKTWGSPSDWRV